MNESKIRELCQAAAVRVGKNAGVAVDHDEAVTLLSAVFDAWENGDDCHEDGDPSSAYMGKAFKLDDEIFDRCCALLNRLNPPRNVSAATVKAVPSEALSLTTDGAVPIKAQYRSPESAGDDGWCDIPMARHAEAQEHGYEVRYLYAAAPLADKTTNTGEKA